MGDRPSRILRGKIAFGVITLSKQYTMAWAGSQNREQTKRKYYRFGQKCLVWVRKEGIPDLRLIQQPKLLEFIASWVRFPLILNQTKC